MSQKQCPKCGKYNIKNQTDYKQGCGCLTMIVGAYFIYAVNSILGLLGLVIGIIVIILASKRKNTKYTCEDCGYIWEEEKP